MKNNKLIIILISVFLCLLIWIILNYFINRGSSQLQIQNNLYTINTEKIIYNDAKIEYPKITNLGDLEKEKKVNKIIKEFVIGEQIAYGEELLAKLVIEKFYLDVNYEITLSTNNIISIIFFNKSADNTSKKYYYDTTGLTINMTTMEIMGLDDFVSDYNIIEDQMIESKNIKFCTNLKYNNKSGIEEFISEMLNDYSLANNNQHENKHNFYLTPTSLGIIIDAPHSYSDCLLIEVDK